jgi:uncharacterized protein YqeY
MKFEDRITTDMKTALKSGQKKRLVTLRSLRAMILEFQKSGKNEELTEEKAIELLNKAAKNRKDSIAMYLQAGRTELAESEKTELNIIQEYLPAQLSEEELNTIILSIIKKTEAKEISDMGKVMGVAMQEVKGKADGSAVQQVVRKLLSDS